MLDVGFWGRDERSALVGRAEAVGAQASIVNLDGAEATQVARLDARFRAAPDTTFALSATDLAGWRAAFEVPTDDVARTCHPRSLAVDATWSYWGSARWPSLPPLTAMRIQQPAREVSLSDTHVP